MGNVTAGGPRAPKDPTKKRPAVYLMLDDVIEGTLREDGRYAEICFLEGRVKAKIMALAPEMPEEIAEGLQTCAGLRKYVHSIGIAASAQEKELLSEKLQFSLNCRRENDYGGTVYRAEVPLNGQEVLIELADYPASELDTALASFRMQFERYMTAKMTIIFYLNDGFEVPELIPDPPVDFASPEYRRMIEASLLQEGNLFRLKRAIAKAKRGEEVTIAYIGGSITQGAGAKPIGTNSYAYQSCLAFRRRFGAGDGSNVHLVKAGVGGTPSELGLCRYENEVLRGGTVQPDIVVIEFAVNDAGDETNGVCYESLALMAAKGPGTPAVVLLFAVFMDDFNLQDRLACVGENYGFPMVSLKNAVTPQFYQEKPVLTKRQYFYDLYHPSNTGHRIMADCLDYLWERADAATQMFSEVDYDRAPAIGNTYQGLKVFTRADILALGGDGMCYPGGVSGEDRTGDAGAEKAGRVLQAVKSLNAGSFSGTDREVQYVERDADAFATPEFPENWMYAGDGTSGSFRMTIRCRDLLLIYKDSGDRKFGKAEAWVDGSLARVIDPLEVGWNHCNAYIIHTGECAAEHEVELRLAEADKCFTILGFGYTE
ncbi:MAG: SGNH/GDSL hydrolase family protein [Lachnospiraceae bacterium]|nr:SGNH/GDSL hydrolase family protein [Lachnospiraceae bacterium]